MTTNNQANGPKKPEDLSIYEIHSPQAIRDHRNAVAAYFEAVRAEEERLRQLALATEAEANRPLTDEERFAESVKKFNADKAAADAKKLAQIEAELAEAQFMASTPPTVEISERSEFTLLRKFQHWFAKGYTADENSILHWMPGFVCIQLHAPAKKA